MKKIYLLAMICTCFSLSIFANGVEIDGIYYLLDSTNYTASVTYTGSSHSNNSYMGEVFIPSSVDYNSHVYSVTSIGEGAFSGCRGLTSVTIPNSVTSIGDNAFNNCNSLTSIKIPNSVTSIGNNVFSFCSSLISIEIPNSVTSIGGYSFYGCKGLTSPVYNAHVFAFMPTSYSGAYTISDGIESIAGYAFYNCSGLTSVTIPNSVTSIGSSAFRECSGLASVTIPNSVTSIGESAFEWCNSLTSIMIPNSITEIGSGTFWGCTRLTLVTIANSVTSIGDGAFYNCNSLTSITIPNSVTSIGEETFLSCSSLTSVYCEAAEPPSVGLRAFDGIHDTAILYVPYESVEAYSALSEYANAFAEIKGFSHVEDITSSSATLKWLPDTAVTQYDINVYTSDTLFAQYLVDGNGQVLFSQQFAPSVYHHKLDTTTSSTEYFVISLNGLSASTDYNYTIEGKNTENVSVYHEEGSFKTLNEGEEGLFDITSDDPRKQARKILYNGQIYILRGEKVYTVTGEEVR